MPEFRFRCPRCKKQIQCDTSYIAATIQCPACQESIVVPLLKAPTGEQVIEFKTSTLKRAAIISLSVILIVTLGVVAVHFLVGSRSMTFKANVDGTDIVKLRGDQLWVEHLQWQRPDGMSIDGAPWNPAWNDDTTARYSLSHSFMPGNPDKIKLSKHVGRGTITITEKPSPANQETLAIKVDDGPTGGAALYEFTVSW